MVSKLTFFTQLFGYINAGDVCWKSDVDNKFDNRFFLLLKSFLIETVTNIITLPPTFHLNIFKVKVAIGSWSNRKRLMIHLKKETLMYSHSMVKLISANYSFVVLNTIIADSNLDGILSILM